MGNIILIDIGKVSVKPLRNRLEAIQKMHLPTTLKGCRRFVGMVIF